MNFTGIEAKQTPFYFSEAWVHLEPAAERNQHFTQEGLRGVLLSGEAQLWCAFRGEEMVAACVTETARVPKGMRCEVLLCGGTDMGSWLHECLPVIEAWAKECGCTKMRIEGRRGWAKALPDYAARNVVLTKELCDA